MNAFAVPDGPFSFPESVGDPARPTGNFPVIRQFAHLPGEGGVLAGARNLLGWMRHGNAHLLEQKARYGSVYRHVFGRVPAVFVADADALGAIARNECGSFSAALAWKVFFEGINPSRNTFDSLSGMDFEPHRQARKALQPAFGAAAIADYLEQATEVFDRATNEWVRLGRVSFKSAVRRLFADVAGRVFIGTQDAKESLRMDRAISNWWGAPLALAKHRILSPKWRRAMQADVMFRDMLRPGVEHRRRASGTDLFSRMCRIGTELAWLDDDVLVGLLLSIMSASFDMTARGITSMGYLLAKHPEWQNRLRAEGGRSTRYVELKQLQQHDLVWKEALRLYPVGAGLPRQALRDVDLLGVRLPAGSFVIALIGPVLQDPKWWSNPLSFDPERFAPERAEDKRHRSAFVPFGAGAHACIGMQLANFQAKAFWSMLLSKCRIRLARDYRARHEYRPLGSVSGSVDLVLEPV